jgi:hypothetical protein
MPEETEATVKRKRGRPRGSAKPKINMPEEKKPEPPITDIG